MFDKDFYPTPPEVADKMLEGLEFWSRLPVREI